MMRTWGGLVTCHCEYNKGRRRHGPARAEPRVRGPRRRRRLCVAAETQASRIVTEASGAASLASAPPPRPQNQHVGAAASSSIGSSSCRARLGDALLERRERPLPPKSGCDLEIASGAARTGSSSAAASSAAAAGGPRAGRVVALHGVGRDQRAPGPGQAALRGQARTGNEAARVRALVVQGVALHLMMLSSWDSICPTVRQTGACAQGSQPRFTVRGVAAQRARAAAELFFKTNSNNEAGAATGRRA